jgi:hypothetical protein
MNIQYARNLIMFEARAWFLSLIPSEGDPILVRAQRDSLASQLEGVQAFAALHNNRELELNLESLEALSTREPPYRSVEPAP